LVCPSCRGKIASRKRARFAGARRVIIDQAKRRGLTNPSRPGGRHSEKFLTLTLPHVAEHGVAARIEYVQSAWAPFLKSMNAWLRKRGETAEWLRSAEWTPGTDSQGHPHIHVWFFGPFVPQDQVTGWWREGLVRVGFPRAHLDALLVHVCAVRKGKVEEGGGIVTEVIKYMTKDVVEPGRYVDPGTYARVYEAFDGRRTLQASRGFMALAAKPGGCRECGAEASLRVEIAKRPDWAEHSVSDDCARIDAATGAPRTWAAEIEASLSARQAAGAKYVSGAARECAVCTDRGASARLKRRSLDGRTLVTLCKRCVSHVGPRRLGLDELASEVAASLRRRVSRE
jgi:hypothetical protein